MPIADSIDSPEPDTARYLPPLAYRATVSPSDFWTEITHCMRGEPSSNVSARPVLMSVCGRSAMAVIRPAWESPTLGNLADGLDSRSESGIEVVMRRCPLC